jgi:hypothetical protein
VQGFSGTPTSGPAVVDPSALLELDVAGEVPDESLTLVPSVTVIDAPLVGELLVSPETDAPPEDPLEPPAGFAGELQAETMAKAHENQRKLRVDMEDQDTAASRAAAMKSVDAP